MALYNSVYYYYYVSRGLHTYNFFRSTPLPSNSETWARFCAIVYNGIINDMLNYSHLLAVPRFRLNTYGRRAFSVADAMACNSLPDFIRDPTSSTDCFRRLVKTYLFARY